MKRRFALILFLSVFLFLHAQHQGKPMGWVTCNSATQANYELKGGEGGKQIILKSTGKDMRQAILNAISQFDIIILDGEKGPFVVSSTLILQELSHKTIIGRNNAQVCTQFHLTPRIIKKLNNINVKQYSSTGEGGTLSNGQQVHEAQELMTRQTLIDHLNDQEESYRHAGLFVLWNCHDFIIQGLKLQGPGSVDVGGDDLLTITRGSTHIWIDNCQFSDGMDGNFDINSYSDYITISNCSFGYSKRAFSHMNTNLIGSNDNPQHQGVGTLKVTFYQCTWLPGCDQRMPMARFGTIHILSCTYLCSGCSLAINARKDANILIEKCIFAPGVRNIFSQREAKAWVLRDNIYAEPFECSNHGEVHIPYTY